MDVFEHRPKNDGLGEPWQPKNFPSVGQAKFHSGRADHMMTGIGVGLGPGFAIEICDGQGSMAIQSHHIEPLVNVIPDIRLAQGRQVHLGAVLAPRCFPEHCKDFAFRRGRRQIPPQIA
jgi:hypothetical protein